MDKILRLYIYVDGGANDTPFPSADNPIEIGAFRYDAKRMGGAPTITASVNYASCLDDEWTYDVYAMFNGERYYLKQIPTSSYNNTSAMYKHDVELISERAALDNIYFFDVASKSIVEDDKPVSNSTKVVFFGNVSEFAQRLNASLEYSGLDYRVVVDDVVTSEEKLISFEDQFFSNVLQEIYNTYEVPYYFEGKTIHIGFSKLLSEGEELPIFSYGVDDALLSITKNNANYKIVNRATGEGSSENIPYYYPNSAPKGEIEISTSGSLTNDDIKITDIEAFNRLYVDKEYAFKGDTSLNTVDERVTMPSLLQESPFVDGAAVVEKLYIEENSVGLEVRYNLFFDTETSTEIDLSWELSNPCNPAITMTPPLKNAYGKDQLEIKVEKVSIDSPSYKSDNYPCDIITDKHTYYESVTYRKGQTSTGKTNNKNIDTGIKISTPNLRGDVTVIVHLKFKTLGNFWDNVPDYFWGESSKKRPYSDILFYSSVDTMTTGGWQTEEGDSINMENYGIKFLRNPQYGDSFRYTIVKYVTPSNVLLPPKYRETDGKERFYNATNGTYEGVTFNNPFVVGKPREHIIKVEDIKPSIEGMVVNGQRIDMFEAFAYDLYDNDETYEGEDGNVYFKHPYFFAKLKPLGFNLFDHAIEQQPMTISFTSGACGACNFEIAVDEESQKNTVQVDDNGNVIYDENGRVLCGAEDSGQNEVQPQDVQQDTTNHSVWIALQKEESTYGILMPKAPENGVGEHRPTTDDTFVILGINLPNEYILNAERRLEAEIIKYLQDNNDEKFTFSIGFSRIYFAENEDVLNSLNENSKIQITYDNKTYDLYVSSFSYTMSESDALPEIKVELDETLKISQNALQNAINEVKTTLGGAIDELSRNLLSDKKYISKIKDDTALGTVDFRKGVKFGEGGKVEVLDNNSAKLTIEYLEVTKKATFTSLEIQEKTHVGGQMLVTPASMNCGEVEELEDAYRCYFQTKGADGSEEIFNQFAVGDQAICQTFNAWGSKYYWRLVVGVGEDYIDLSKEDCDEGSGVPEAGDRIIQMGNRDNADRQNAIVIAAHGDNSPYIVQYKGINNFDLPKTDNDPRITTLLSPTKNVLTGQVKMVAGSSGLELFDEWAEKQALIDSKASGEDFDAFKSLVDKDIENIKKQVDGAITTWFYDAEPTLNNAPAVDWATDEDKNNHLGDLYYSGAGKAYRFQYDEATTTYYWNLIEDEDITEALGLAQQAKDTADGKRRVFVVQPTPPYDEGDLWSRGSTLPMMVCVNTKTSGSFAEGDWDFADNTSQLATQIAGYEYIKEAIQNGSTIVTGGLIQSGILMLGYTNANGQYQVMSGTNGVYNASALGGGIAAWYGGVMEEGVANAIIRFDGSGYFAKGNLSWDNKGGASFADGKITITPQGALIFSDDIAFGSNENETVASIIQGLSTVLSYFTLDDAKTTLTSKYNLVIEGDVASGGDGQDTPGGSGGVSEEDVLDILEKNNYITSAALSSYYTKGESDARYLASSLLGSNTLIHNGNIGSYKAGGLATPINIWGQSFDGTRDIGGSVGYALSLEFNGVPSTAGHGGFIDFHFNGSSADYTSRIIESNNGLLAINGELFVKNGGNVLIGNTHDNGGKLQVHGTINVTEANGAINFTNGLVTGNASVTLDVVGSSYARLQTSHYGVAYTCPLCLNPLGGNVLIGTTTDSGSRLTISNPSSRDVLCINSNASNGPIVYLAASNQLMAGFGYDGVAKVMWFENFSASSGLYLNNVGNVGIGTSSPAYKLDVNGKIRFETRTIWGQSFDGTGDVLAGSGVGLMSSKGYYYGLSILPTGSPYWGVRTFLTYDQGSTMGAYEIASRNSYGLTISHGGGVAYDYGNIPSNLSYTALVNIMPNGNVGIGIISPSAKLHVDGQINISGGTYNNYSFIRSENYASNQSLLRIGVCYGYSVEATAITIRYGVTSVTGDLIVSGDTSSGSDIRFKDVIKNKTLKIEHIAKAPLFTFKWNDREDDTIHLGSSAQYWENIAPWLVSGSDFKSLNYAILGVAMGISLAKKSINHEERIKELERKVKSLEEENRRLRYGN